MLLFRLLTFGGVACAVAGLLLGVALGGVPYHDGPNSGHLSAPGIGRVMEYASDWLLAGGLVLFIVGLLGLAAVGLARLVLRS